MTNELMRMLRGSSLVQRAIALFVDMIKSDEYLYTEAWRVITSDEKVDQIPQYFYNADIKVNNQEKEIRRILFEHLSIRPKNDISGCLVLMSLVKDAERIGDYTKNVFEAGILHGSPITDLKFYDRINKTQQDISANLSVLGKAFKNSDEKIATDILKHYNPIKRDCDKVLHELFKADVSVNEAVITAMLSRYLKRINSHVSNIASGIIYPLNEIDFVKGSILE